MNPGPDAQMFLALVEGDSRDLRGAQSRFTGLMSYGRPLLTHNGRGVLGFYPLRDGVDANLQAGEYGTVQVLNLGGSSHRAVILGKMPDTFAQTPPPSIRPCKSYDVSRHLDIGVQLGEPGKRAFEAAVYRGALDCDKGSHIPTQAKNSLFDYTTSGVVTFKVDLAYALTFGRFDAELPADMLGDFGDDHEAILFQRVAEEIGVLPSLTEK